MPGKINIGKGETGFKFGAEYDDLDDLLAAPAKAPPGGYDYKEILDEALEQANLASHTGSKATYKNGAQKVVVFGEGFKFDDGDDMTAGAVTKVEIYQGKVKVGIISAIEVEGALFQNAMDSYDDNLGSYFGVPFLGGLPFVFKGSNQMDFYQGGKLADDIFGRGAADYLYGGMGEDIIDGGSGDNELWGEAGADEFRFSSLKGFSHIADFEAGDTLAFDRSVFKGIGKPGDMDDGLVAVNISNQINVLNAIKIYVMTNGEIYWNKPGVANDKLIGDIDGNAIGVDDFVVVA